MDTSEKEIKRSKKLMQTFNYIGKIISYAVIVLLFIIGGFLIFYLASAQKFKNDPSYIPPVSLYTIISGSMEPTIKVYDVVLDTKVESPDEINVGDVITFISTSSISNNLVVTHRVVAIEENEDGEKEYVTKGDYNEVPDSSTAKFENIIGKVRFRIPQLGRLQFFLSSSHGWFIVVVFPALGVIIYDVIKIFKLVKAKKSADRIAAMEKNAKTDIVGQAIDKVKKTDYLDKLIELQKIYNDNLSDDKKEELPVEDNVYVEKNEENNKES